MAEAVMKTVTDEKVLLVLSKEEAEVLMAVGAKIGGDRLHSHRRHFEAILNALSQAGVKGFTHEGEHPYRYLKAYALGLYFTDKPDSEIGPFRHHSRDEMPIW
ncbi:hypothetical protein [Streptomyces sp. NPDC053048]|uniref:hypothetical protein n=1 Tax=Streptomyces sp. NPDC053048 TaxID=3365694 RepID=UPI0037CF12F7